MISTRLTLSVVALLAASALSACGAETTAAEADHAGHSSTETAVPSASATPSPADTRPTGNVIRIEVMGGELSPPAHLERVGLGESVTLAVTSDVADEVHLHGYDAHVDLVAGQEGVLTFTADIPGRFEAELEGAGALLVEIEVK
ncbi:hypothetical protein ACIA03_10825 [Nocardioides sp. NPDC051685]|uniref:hypothetical protein n=1 Tax=Nocardioides sp. NPDC051685 TaxID=3364334 RepID=UPI0037939047